MKVDWKKYEEKVSNFFTKHIIKIAIIAVVVVLGFYFLQFHCVLGIQGSSWKVCDFLVPKFPPRFFSDLSGNKGDWGTFGDFVGGTLNPILSFLALIVLLRTYAMQREELKRTEETQKRQQFESMFFSLLNVHNQLLQELLKMKDTLCSDGIRRDSLNIIKDVLFEKESLSLLDARDMLSTGNEMWGHYFRTLYQLLKFIAVKSPDSEISDEFEIQEIKRTQVKINEKMYSNIVRGLLHDDILQILCVNCCVEDNDNKDNYHRYKALIERYAFFEHASFKRENDENERYQKYPVLLKARSVYNYEKAFGVTKQNQENP